jgi:hypothetical protein
MLRAPLHYWTYNKRPKEDTRMTADIAKAMQRERIEKLESTRCPKRYCKFEKREE